MKRIVNKCIAVFLAVILLLPTNGQTQSAPTQILPYMPPSGQLLNPSIKYDLPCLKGIKFNADNPLKFTFVFNKSDLPLTESILKDEAQKIGKYFLAALTIFEDDLWVNLSPYEQNRIMPDKLSQTDLGKDMLGEDYVLKQLAASLTYPDSETGKKYWQSIDGVGARSPRPLFGRGNPAPTQTFNKVWIVPDKIHIYESPNMVVIDYARLKVLTETDYLAMNKNNLVGARSPRPGQGNPAPTESFKKYILPSIEKEVNVGKNFAHLRQLYSAIILAVWFKDKIHKAFLNRAGTGTCPYDNYFGKNKIKGADCNDPKIKEKIYNEYVKAFNQGVYNIIKKEFVGANGRSPVGAKIIKRQYFSGGERLTEKAIRAAALVTQQSSAQAQDETSGLSTVDLAAEDVAQMQTNLAISPQSARDVPRDSRWREAIHRPLPQGWHEKATNDVATTIMQSIKDGNFDLVMAILILADLLPAKLLIDADLSDGMYNDLQRKAYAERILNQICDRFKVDASLDIKGVVDIIRGSIERYNAMPAPTVDEDTDSGGLSQGAFGSVVR